MQDAKIEARIRRKFRSVAVQLDETEAMDGRGSTGRWLGQNSAGGSNHRLFSPHNHGWTEGSGTFVKTLGCRRGSRAASRWLVPDIDLVRYGIVGCPGAVDRSGNAWRPRVSVALVMQKHRQVGRGADATKSSRHGSRSGSSLQADRKTREGSSRPDRNAQFEYINRQVRAFQRRQEPNVWVDTKKRELVGEFKNPGR
jgi:hypothetical protein